MNILAKISAVGVTAVAMCGIGIGTAAAATPVHDGATSVITVTAYEGDLHADQTVNNLSFTCPAGDPWLQNVDYSPGRIVPRGVQVLETGGVGVSAFGTAGDDHRATGYDGLSATNWNLGVEHLQVIAHCTNDANQAYN